MKYLKKFNESEEHSNESLTQEDFEDYMLELLDIDFVVEEFKNVYVNDQIGTWSDDPVNGYVKGYFVRLSNKYEYGEESGDESLLDIHDIESLKKVDNLRSKIYSTAIGCFSRIKSMVGEVRIPSWNTLDFSILVTDSKSSEVSVSEKEHVFNQFIRSINSLLKIENRFEEDKFVLTKDKFTVLIKAKESVNNNRFTQVFRRISCLSNRQGGQYDFEKRSSYVNRLITLEFNHAKKHINGNGLPYRIGNRDR